MAQSVVTQVVMAQVVMAQVVMAQGVMTQVIMAQVVIALGVMGQVVIAGYLTKLQPCAIRPQGWLCFLCRQLYERTMPLAVCTSVCV